MIEKPHPSLSILIPTRNFAPNALVRALARQTNTTYAETEILVLDDASSDTTSINALKTLEQEGVCRVLWQPVNQGRARARNILYKESRGEWLLFIDSDAEVLAPDFLIRHLADATLADVVCGGLVNPPPPATRGCELRYKYETAATRKGRRNAQWRNAHPYECISTFNILVNRRVMDTAPFNDSLNEYGYEDTAFGLSLQRHGFSVLHTDNALLHTGITPSPAFLANTEAALRNLTRLPYDIQCEISVARLAERLRNWHLDAPLRLLFRFAKPLLCRNLISQHPSLSFFQLYKLCFLLSLKKNKPKIGYLP